MNLSELQATIKKIDPDFERVICPLVGEDGNIFSIIGRVLRQMREAEVSPEIIQLYVKSIKQASNYNEALAITLEFVKDPTFEEGSEKVSE